MLSQSFRAWLAERLRETKFARGVIPDDEIDVIAKRLGVEPDLLLEVRAAMRVEMHKEGRRMPRGPTVPGDVQARHRRVYQLHLYIPIEIFPFWKDECEFRGIEGSVLLRSIIHAYLLSKYEPQDVLTGWRWKGKRYKTPQSQQRGKVGLERTVIPQGAKRALARRARRSGTTSTAIVRGLVLEALRGLHRVIPLVEPAMMWDDEGRYEASPEGPLDRVPGPR